MGLKWQEYKIVLGSQSPRRAQLLRDMGLSFRQLPANIEESYPSNLEGPEIAAFLASKKAEILKSEINAGEILICSDTVVWIDGKSLEKASDKLEARTMLKLISGKKHQVITGLHIGNMEKEVITYDQTTVYFKELDDRTIDYYIEEFKPFDKAGAYGIQEWIGMIGVEKIEGSYFTVMGLPCHIIAETLKNW